MAQVRTRDEALAAADQALARWETVAAGCLTQAAVIAESARSLADGKVRHWRSRVSACQAFLDSVGPDGDARRIRAELMRAQQGLQTALRAQALIDAAAQQVRSLQRAHAQRTNAQISAARADLRRRTSALDSYRAAVSGGGSGASSVSQNSGGGDSIISSMGLASIDVSAADFRDNPVIGQFGRGGTTRADYRWAVQTWDEVVGPGVARGMTRSDFEARDSARCAAPLRRTAAVYDMFLGDTDRIRVSRRSDGSLDVTNGRHRLEVARELGVRSLPGQVVE